MQNRHKKIPRAYQVKVLVTILVSNFFVYILASNNEVSEVKPNHLKTVTLTAASYVAPITGERIPISILNNDHEVLTNKAYLLNGIQNEGEAGSYTVEISPRKITQIIEASKTSGVQIYPALENELLEVNQYEIQF